MKSGQNGEGANQATFYTPITEESSSLETPKKISFEECQLELELETATCRTYTPPGPLSPHSISAEPSQTNLLQKIAKKVVEVEF